MRAGNRRASVGMTELIPSILLLGPSGAGKSSLIKQAMKARGSGLVIGAPGEDEKNSYADLLDVPGYQFRGFDDDEFQPLLGDWKATGYKAALTFLKEEARKLKEIREKKGVLPYSVLGLDTASALGRLAMNATYAEFKMHKPPPAQSPEGAAFYGFLRSRQEDIWRLARSIRSSGVVLIAASHTIEREVSEAANANAVKGAKSFVPDLPGGFRDSLPGYFDLVFHVGVKREKDPKDAKAPSVTRHYLQFRPSPNKPTKIRYGNWTESSAIPNDWSVIAKAIGLDN